MSILRASSPTPSLDSRWAWLTLDRCRPEVIIGLLPHERAHPQPLELELALGFTHRSLLLGATTGALSYCVNYAHALEWLKFIARAGHYKLLESLWSACVQLILAPPAPLEERAQIEAVSCGLWKPNILSDARPGLTASIDRDSLSQTLSLIDHHRVGTPMRPVSEPLHIDLMVSAPEVSLERLVCAEGQLGALDVNAGESIHILSGRWTFEGSQSRSLLQSTTGPEGHLKVGTSFHDINVSSVRLHCVDGGALLRVRRHP